MPQFQLLGLLVPRFLACRQFLLGTIAWALLTMGAADAETPPADKPIPTTDAVKAMKLPDGFKATLFAGEPDIVQPIAFTFDDRGRMWVVECLSYPKWTSDGSGHDRITILEDTNGDGVHDKRTVFFDQSVNVSGIEVGFGGVWLLSIPNLVFIPDANSDDKPDGPPQVKLEGWDLGAKHNVPAALGWGPDGWLYGCNGILSKSRVGLPGSPLESRPPLDCGTWRYHPTENRYEPFAYGTTNPWGLDWDDYGQAFVTNCVIKHLFHFVPGAHCDRMFGQDVNPNIFHPIPSIADHFHWAGGHWTTSRGGAEHSDFGGGHAHSGAAVYLADQFPAEYRNSIFMCNIHGNRLNRNLLTPKGSSYVGERAPDFLFANDPWFRGVAVKQGPEGALYVSDWCDTGECHNYDVADQTNGRIYRVTYGDYKQPHVNLAKLSDSDLVARQQSANEWQVRRARRLLQERSAAGRLSGDALSQLEQQLQTAKTTPGRLRAGWALHATGQLTVDNYIVGLNHPDEHIRYWSILLGLDSFPEDANFLKAIARKATVETSPQCLLGLACAAQKLARGSDAARNTAIEIVWVIQAKPAVTGDSYLPHMVWFAAEAFVEKDPVAATRLLTNGQYPLLRQSLARRLALLPQGLPLVLKAIASDNTQVKQAAVWQADALKGILQAYAGVRELAQPAEWPAARLALQKLTDPEAQRDLRSLAVLIGDEAGMEELRVIVANQSVAAIDREHALGLLVNRRAPGIVDLLLKLLNDPSVRGTAIRSLSQVGDTRVPEALLNAYVDGTDTDRQDTIQTLTSRAEWGLALANAVGSGQVPKADVSTLTIRQLRMLNHPELNRLLTEVWGEIKPASQQKQELAEKYRLRYTPDVVAQANLKNGRSVFTKNCGNCHKLFGEGYPVGPELTGSQRGNLEYLLDNVLDPSAIVPFDYRMSVIALDDGRVIQGIVVAENNVSLTVQLANQRLIVDRSQVEEIVKSNVSLMPEGLFDNLAPNDLRDLIGYLRSPEQVPLDSK